MAELHYVGDKVRLGCAAATMAGVATDPTTLAVTVKPPLGAAVTYTWPDDVQVVRTGTGAFYYDFTIAEADSGKVVHQVRWVATGALVKAAQTSFRVAAVNV